MTAVVPMFPMDGAHWDMLAPPHGTEVTEPFQEINSPSTATTRNPTSCRTTSLPYAIQLAEVSIQLQSLHELSLDSTIENRQHEQDVQILQCKKKWPGMCCSNGKVRLPALDDPPQLLQELFSGESTRSKEFREKLWKYNSAFSMTSFGADRNVTDHGFFTIFKIQGQCYHQIGSLLPMPDTEAKFLQDYFMNGQEETQQRIRNNPGTQADLIQDLQSMLHQYHQYINIVSIGLLSSKLIVGRQANMLAASMLQQLRKLPF
ncbi:hypothetical protein CAPTEDRAFT_202282 [Capitella teleta]|uniref:Uncharacterized protein n=1 Tax=Capitella teleta TaxID=283909 RepID=R7TH21_CAPTE|nr:hypothetical protein CAPTEDRAFT_202282 [Capitella teleta]|eukprot:ELT90405.1 hypothetical protein CAPTEDRAFT_202282 [Capitella teleta]